MAFLATEITIVSGPEPHTLVALVAPTENARQPSPLQYPIPIANRLNQSVTLAVCPLRTVVVKRHGIAATLA